MKKVLFTLLAVLLLLCSCSEVEPVGKAHIITIGIDYKDHSLTGFQEIWPSFDNPVSDAGAIGNCFKDIYEKENVPYDLYSMILQNTAVVGTKPTKENIIQTIQNLNVSPEDLIVFYFSGHGGNDIDGAYLMVAYEHFYTEELIAMLQNKGCNVFVLLDCCKNGAIHEGTRLIYNGQFKDNSANHMSLIAASNIEESSYLYNSSVFSCYTQCFLEALNYDKETEKVTSITKGLNTVDVFNKSIELFAEHFPELVISKGTKVQHPEMGAKNLNVMLIPRN